MARRFGLTPRVALLASSTFGFPRSERSERIIEAVQILPDEQRALDFGHADLFLATDAQKLVWKPILDWLVAHR